MVVSILIPKASVFSLLFSSCVFAVVSAAFAGKVTCGKNGMIKANARKILKNRCFILSLPFFLILLVPFLILQKNAKNVNIFVQNASFLKKIYLCGERKAKVSSLSIRKALLTYFLFLVDNLFYFFYNGASFIFNNTI